MNVVTSSIKPFLAVLCLAALAACTAGAVVTSAAAVGNRCRP